MEKGNGTGNTGAPAANAAGRKKKNTPGSQRGRRENEEGRPQRWSGAARTIRTGARPALGAYRRLPRLLRVNHAWPAGCPLVDAPRWEPYDRTIFAGHVAARESPSGPATARTRHRCLLDTLTFFAAVLFSATGSFRRTPVRKVFVRAFMVMGRGWR